MIIKEFCAENTTLLSQLDSSVKRLSFAIIWQLEEQHLLMVSSKKLRAISRKRHPLATMIRLVAGTSSTTTVNFASWKMTLSVQESKAIAWFLDFD